MSTNPMRKNSAAGAKTRNTSTPTAWISRSPAPTPPRIDKNLYARQNGLAISGLSAYYNVTDDPHPPGIPAKLLKPRFLSGTRPRASLLRATKYSGAAGVRHGRDVQCKKENFETL
ncbi:hypothetical protein [Bradyrhizobium australiense]|uniref:Uncharacterized protein n=1 Tax=Bradyrhizobium australiense TaxID=2721161 RepID=A0A7Y4GUG1_9BRAD|nr:hypothetical protein [Bradyrhizobium australiense]NOJ41977.1 hypothetical protein [Bradyrhizobium australiense]